MARKDTDQYWVVYDFDQCDRVIVSKVEPGSDVQIEYGPASYEACAAYIRDFNQSGPQGGLDFGNPIGE